MMAGWWRFEGQATLEKSSDIHDGDSLKVTIRLEGFGACTLLWPSLRLDGIDSLEVNDTDPARRAKAMAARDRARALVPVGVPLTIETHKMPGDKYGRWLARVYLSDGRLLNDVLLAEGMAVPYDGGKKG